MASVEELTQLFKQTGAILEGHFLLTSGLHSPGYVQCALVLQHPGHAERLGRWLASQFHNRPIDFVISPAIGGIVLGQEVARSLQVRALFTEREEGRLTLRRGFTIDAGEHALVVEDVVTTGGTTLEVIHLVEERGGTVEGVGTLVDRSLSPIEFGYPFCPLLTQRFPLFPPQACPLCQAGSTPVKPGSRKG